MIDYVIGFCSGLAAIAVYMWTASYFLDDK